MTCRPPREDPASPSQGGTSTLAADAAAPGHDVPALARGPRVPELGGASILAADPAPPGHEALTGLRAA